MERSRRGSATVEVWWRASSKSGRGPEGAGLYYIRENGRLTAWAVYTTTGRCRDKDVQSYCICRSMVISFGPARTHQDMEILTLSFVWSARTARNCAKSMCVAVRAAAFGSLIQPRQAYARRPCAERYNFIPVVSNSMWPAVCISISNLLSLQKST